MLRLENVVDPIVVGRAAVCWEMEVFVGLGEVSAAHQAFAFEHGGLELQLVRAALLRDRLYALVVVGLIQSVALCLPLVCKVYKTVREVGRCAQAGKVAVKERLVGICSRARFTCYSRLKLVLRVCPT